MLLPGDKSGCKCLNPLQFRDVFVLVGSPYIVAVLRYWPHNGLDSFAIGSTDSKMCHI